MINLDNKLIHKFFSNKCSIDEHKEVTSYLNSLNEKELDAFMEFQIGLIENGIIDVSSAPNPRTDRIFSKVSRSSHYLTVIQKHYYYSIAASILLMVLLTSSILYFLGVFDTQHESITWNEKKTELGQKAILTLFDGTIITLNADSKLKYPRLFGNTKREVYLEGEAYFEVAHHPEIPFVVHSAEISTHVLGTKFDVKAFPEEREIIVSLVEGRIKVEQSLSFENNEDLLLLPNQQLRINKDNGDNQISTFDLEQIIGWKDNNLKFDDEPLSKVLIVLERFYGISFEINEKSLGDRKITANFGQDSFWTTIKVISEIARLKYKTLIKNGELQKVIFY